jgi:metal-responsive CopG/Arc/MetJ family transcriptional regulator
MTLQYIPVRLTPELVDALDGIAGKHHKSRAQVIREGLRFFVERHAILTEAEIRRLTADEFVFLALDTIIREKHSNSYKSLLDEAARRVRVLHG